MRLLTIIVFTLILNSAFGQKFPNDSIINRFIQNFSDRGIDTILIYESACVGCEILVAMEKNDSCIYYGDPQISYIFWKNKGLTYASKVSNFNCYKYDTIIYDIKLIWDLYFENKSVVKMEQILPPSYINKKDTFFVDIDHYDYDQIMFVDRKDNLVFVMNDFYFEKTIDEKHTNRNFAHNSNTFRRKLQIQVDNEIKKIEDNRLIKKQHYKNAYK